MLDGVPTFPYPASDTFLALLAVSSVSPKDIVSSIGTVQEAERPHGFLNVSAITVQNEE